MFEKDFTPVLRFAVVSDVHYKDEHTIERDRMKQAIQTAYRLSDESEYKKLDAFYVVGDFANNGSPTQMKAFRQTLDENIRPGTVWNVSLASHEFGYDGPDGAKQRLREIFDLDTNTHRVINGFHFISVGCDHSCRFEDGEKKFAFDSLEEAVADSRKKPIFFFQHPHITDTVLGSINWGEDDMIPIMVNYPQIIDFSGHSHAPINDPRSIHQRHFTALGTGTLSYFEGDDFDKYYGTVFPGAEKAAQMLIVEADAKNRVRVYPYDLITDNFFPYVWKIDTPSDPTTYIYTDARYNTGDRPYFKEGAKPEILNLNSRGFDVRFPQAAIDSDYVCDYSVYVIDTEGNIIRHKSVWSEYYFYDMPECLTVPFDDLKPGEYKARIFARSFWNLKSEKCIESEFVKLPE